MSEIFISLTVEDPAEATLQVDDDVGLSLGLSEPYINGGTPYYDGEYEITPSQSTQTLETAHLKMRSNVVINPIPSNYGLITWDGSKLRVS